MYKCCNCNGAGEVGESPDGANWYAAACSVCKGAGETQRFVRAPDCDKRVANGDDFAGDAWLDQETRQIVYGAVGHDRNAAALIRQLQAAEQAAWHAGLDAGREQARAAAEGVPNE